MGGNKRKKKYFKQCLFLAVNFCCQSFASPSQSYTWKISVEIFVSPGCCQQNHSCYQTWRKKERVGYIMEIKRLLPQHYSWI